MSSRTLVVAAFFVAACAVPLWAQGTPAQAVVTGTVAYRERMALPPDAAIDVRIEDISLQNAPAKVVAENVFAAAGKQVPIPFQLPYNPADINPAHNYSVRATISVNGQMMFTSTATYPVITRGAPTQVALMLQQAQAPTGASLPPTGAKLQGTLWILVEMNGKPALARMGEKQAYMKLHKQSGRLEASSGCNGFTGSYIVDQSSLRINPGATTTMMCPPELMQQQQTFVDTLKAASSYRIALGTLELLDGSKVVARFQAQAQPKKQF